MMCGRYLNTAASMKLWVVNACKACMYDMHILLFKKPTFLVLSDVLKLLVVIDYLIRQNRPRSPPRSLDAKTTRPPTATFRGRPQKTMLLNCVKCYLLMMIGILTKRSERHTSWNNHYNCCLVNHQRSSTTADAGVCS